MFSYAPDRPAGGAAPRKGKGWASAGRSPASGFGSTEKVQERLGSSELVERMRKERVRATEASRARAAAAAAAAATAAAATATNGSHVLHGGESIESSSQQGDTGYRPSEPNGTAYTAVGRRPVGEGRGGNTEDNRGRNDNRGHVHRPSPPAKQRGGGAVAAAGDGRSSGSNWKPRSDGSSSSGGRGGGALGAARHQGPTRNSRPLPSGGNKKHSLAATAAAGGGENVHAMYEERLAALERRLNVAGKEPQQPRDSVRRDSSNSTKAKQGGSNQSFQPPPPVRGGGEEWGAESNPFGYRKLSAGGGVEEDPGSVPSLGQRGSGASTRSRGGSGASGGEDVEGLSTMYMGPISHKMAELRGGNG